MLVRSKTVAAAPRRQHDAGGALTPTAWTPGERMRLMEWVEQGRNLGVIGRGVGWWIGDWLRYGNMKFGERYVRASRITGYDVQTLMNMVYVASAYGESQRREGLSFSHHAELAALAPDDRERWLDLAESKRLSVRCLREALRTERRQLEGRSTRELESETGAAAAPTCPHCGSALAQ